MSNSMPELSVFGGFDGTRDGDGSRPFSRFDADTASFDEPSVNSNSDERPISEDDGRGLVVGFDNGVPVNASGHKDALKRQYGILGTYELAFTIDCAWAAMGGSIAIAICNGGPPGFLYEMVVAFLWYILMGASIAEMASSIPSSGGVYHWASITPGVEYGRVVGFFAGYINFLGWMFNLAAVTQIIANASVQAYAAFYPDMEIAHRHVFYAYLLVTGICTVTVIFFNRIIPYLQHVGATLVLGGGIATLIVVIAMPKTHATHSFVWADWNNTTGLWDAVAFLTGILSGAFTIGTVDAITHLAEELPNPKKDLPKAIAVQIGMGFLTAFLYAVALFYAISDLPSVLGNNAAFPVVAIYAQATRNNKYAIFGLLCLIVLSLLVCLIGTFLTVSRSFWCLARDHAAPFSTTFQTVDHRLNCPVIATLFVSALSVGLGTIPLSGDHAFGNLAGSFITLTTISYAMAIAPNMLTGRKNMPKGPFSLGKFGFFVNGLTVALILAFNVLFCFPFVFPVAHAYDMNYNSVILVGTLALVAFWWFVHGKCHYLGSKATHLYLDKDRDVVSYAMRRL